MMLQLRKRPCRYDLRSRSKIEGDECTLKEAHDAVRPYATAALKFYNERTQENYKLVEPGDLSSAVVVAACIHHINFKAKKKGVVDAPVERFFAELTTTGINIRTVTLCCCLGPEKLLSGVPKSYGCCDYCEDLGDIYHPRAGGYDNGVVD